MPRLPTSGIVLCQLAAVVAGMAVFALSPPREGPMMLIPTSGTAADAVDVALSAHAALLGRGPLPGSMIVFGERSRIDARLTGRRMILLAAPRMLCGSPRQAGAAS